MTKAANGATMKELLMMVRDELRIDIGRLEAKIDLHIQMDDQQKKVYTEELAKHDALIKHICDELPAKGYCTKVDKMHDALFPQQGQTMTQRVDTLWYDRSILKYILGAAVSALFLSAVTIAKLFFNI